MTLHDIQWTHLKTAHSVQNMTPKRVVSDKSALNTNNNKIHRNYYA